MFPPDNKNLVAVTPFVKQGVMSEEKAGEKGVGRNDTKNGQDENL